MKQTKRLTTLIIVINQNIFLPSRIYRDLVAFKHTYEPRFFLFRLIICFGVSLPPKSLKLSRNNKHFQFHSLLLYVIG
jgi:hypothetical protein